VRRRRSRMNESDKSGTSFESNKSVESYGSDENKRS
jgi:hypothetical protein